MTQDILITPGSGEPQILFRGSGTSDTAIELNVLSSYQSASGSGTALVFEGQEGQLFAVTDNLSSGTIFSVGDITGLSMLSVDASGDVKLGEFANSVIVYPGLTIDDNVPSTTTNVLYNDGGDLKWNGITVIESGSSQAVNGSGVAGYIAQWSDGNTLTYNSTNTISGSYATVVAGSGNVASGARSFVGGGHTNSANGDGAFLGGGFYGCANGTGSTVSAGYVNIASGPFSSVSAGLSNSATAYGSAVVAGSYNSAHACYAGVVAGRSNGACAECSLVGAGQCNAIKPSGTWGFIGGGCSNLICGDNSCYATIGGGFDHTASNAYATVGGGKCNVASGNCSTVGGGYANTASGSCGATVSGGRNNLSSGYYSTTGGGINNCTVGDRSVVSGGEANCACGAFSAVGGGISNSVTTICSNIGGGRLNVVTGAVSSILGGGKNCVTSCYSTLSGGYCSCVSGFFASLVGGHSNSLTGSFSFLGGGKNNTVSGSYAAVAVGSGNIAVDNYSFIGGGKQNCISAGGNRSFIGGGDSNYICNSYTSIGGGRQNCTRGQYNTISGGYLNSTNSLSSAVVGGAANWACNCYAFVGGGYTNRTNGYGSAILGGTVNCITANALYASIGGGQCNFVDGSWSTIAGGYQNTVSGDYSAILGGGSNYDGGYNSVFILGTGITATDSNTTYTQKLNASYTLDPSGTIFNVEGSNGSIFSVVDDLSGALMSVNTIAGLPVLQVNSDYSIVGGRFGQNDFVVTTSGDIGIGTANPSAKLHVSSSSSYATIKITAAANQDTGLVFEGDRSWMIQNDGNATLGSADYLHIFDVTANNSRVTIDTAGNVGIGRTSPAAKLDVNTGTNRALIGSPSFTWGGSGGTYPTLYSNNNSAWIMHVNPHISYVQNGTNGYSGSTNGATVRFASNPAASTYWDIGIGTNGVGNDKLSIGRGGSTNFLAIDNTGNVGIGTTSPSYKLDVSSSVNSPDGAIRVSNSFIGTGAAGTFRAEADTAEAYFQAHSSGRTSSTLYGIVLANHAELRGGVNSVGLLIGNGALDTPIIFGNNNIERMRVDAGGNVGVGTASPNAVLHAYGSTPSGTVFNVEGTNGSLFSVVDNLSGVLMSVNNNAGLPVFEVYDDDSIVAGRFAQNDFVIGSGGNVGIGTDSAVTKLDVSGVVTATGGNSTEWNEAYDWVVASGASAGGGISNVVEDLTPQLGGNLDLNSKNITGNGQINVDNLRLDGNTLSSTNTNGNIVLTPNGTGGIAAGTSATVTGSYSTVSGGRNNTASGNCSTVSGGYLNSASANYSTVGGGFNNIATNDGFIGGSTVSGGISNCACGYFTTVSGGLLNSASAIYSTVGGGSNNTTSGTNSSVSGGRFNVTNARHSTINGGHRNVIQSPTNECCSRGVTIGGGVGHNTSGGTLNATTGDLTGTITCCNAGAFSTIGGGLRNCATGACSTVSGGKSNTVSGTYSSAVGCGNNDNGCCNSHLIGKGLSATATDTTYTNNSHVCCSLTIGSFNHTNLSVASSFGDNDILMAVIDPSGTPSTEALQGSTLRSSLLNQPAELQFRQGTDAERQAITPASGEPIWTTDTEKFYIGNGTTCGGLLMGPTLHERGSGTCSIVAKNTGNTASGNYSTVSGGTGNCASGNCSTVSGGKGNSASGYGSTIGGGGVIIFGSGHNASGSFSTIGGGGGLFGGANTASGNNSTISGGYSNCASGNYSTVSGGYSNSASGNYSTVSGGAVNTASGIVSTVGGGASNCASAIHSTVGGGASNCASASYSTVGGGYYAKASKYGELSHAAGRFAQTGDAQHSTLIARRNTTNATANQVLFLDGSSTRLTIPAETTWMFEIKLAAYNDTNNDGAWWTFRGGIKRNAANGTSLIGTVIEENSKDTNMSTASASVVADDTNEALEIRVTGVASKNIRWVAVVDISQVSWGTP